MKWYHHVLPAVVLAHAFWLYGSLAQAVLAPLAFLLSVVVYAHRRDCVNVLGLFALALISLFAPVVWAVFAGYLLITYLAIYKGMHPFLPFSTLSVHRKHPHLERSLAIWSIVIIFLLLVQ